MGLPFSVNGFAGQTKALQVRNEELWGSKGGGVGGGEEGVEEMWGVGGGVVFLGRRHQQ